MVSFLKLFYSVLPALFPIFIGYGCNTILDSKYKNANLVPKKITKRQVDLSGSKNNNAWIAWDCKVVTKVFTLDEFRQLSPKKRENMLRSEEYLIEQLLTLWAGHLGETHAICLKKKDNSFYTKKKIRLSDRLKSWFLKICYRNKTEEEKKSLIEDLMKSHQHHMELYNTPLKKEKKKKESTI